MRDQELVNAIRRLKVETGSLACMGCGHEYNCGVLGCAVMREAADRIANQSTHIAALQQKIEKLRGQLDLRRCALCDYWLGETDPRCMCGKSPWGGKTTAKDHYCSHWERHTDWISVTERLPEEKQRVIVRCATVGTTVGWMLWDEWMTDMGRGYSAVTHWMPLPEPPKEER